MPEQTSAGSVRVVLSGRKYLQRHDNTANLDIAIQLETCGVTSFVEGAKTAFVYGSDQKTAPFSIAGRV